MLAIRDREFDVSEATFGGILSLDEDEGWLLKWHFEVQTSVRRIDGHEWGPRLYSESLRFSLPAPAALPGCALRVPAAFADEGSPNFALYVFEHESAYNIRMTFGPRRGDAIEITLDGEADIYADDDFGTAVPFRVECPFTFEGICVFHRSEEQARERLAELYDPADFVAERARIGFNYRLRSSGGT